MAVVLIVKTGDAFPEVVDQHGDFETLFEKQLSTGQTQPASATQSRMNLPG